MKMAACRPLCLISYQICMKGKEPGLCFSAHICIRIFMPGPKRTGHPGGLWALGWPGPPFLLISLGILFHKLVFLILNNYMHTSPSHPDVHMLSELEVIMKTQGLAVSPEACLKPPRFTHFQKMPLSQQSPRCQNQCEIFTTQDTCGDCGSGSLLHLMNQFSFLLKLPWLFSYWKNGFRLWEAQRGWNRGGGRQGYSRVWNRVSAHGTLDSMPTREGKKKTESGRQARLVRDSIATDLLFFPKASLSDPSPGEGVVPPKKERECHLGGQTKHLWLIPLSPYQAAFHIWG